MENNIIHVKVLRLLEIQILSSVNAIIYFGFVHNIMKYKRYSFLAIKLTEK